MKKVPWTFFHFIAGFAWLFIVVKLLIYDIDQLLVERYLPQAAFLVDYRLLVFVGLTALLWLYLGHRRFLLFVAFAITFPFWLFFWIVPKRLFLLNRGEWFFVLTYFNAFANFFKALRSNLVLFFLFGTGTVLLLTATLQLPVLLGAILVTGTLLVHYYLRGGAAFQPLSFLGVDSKKLLDLFNTDSFQKALAAGTEPAAGSSANAATEPTDQAEEKQEQRLQNMLLFNRLFLFAARHLQRFRDSRIYVLFFSTGLLWTFIFTAFCGGIVSFGLHRVQPGAYDVPGSGYLFDFFYYAFNAIYGNQVPSVVPTSSMARAFDMILMILGIILLALFASALISARTERYKEELDEAVEVVKAQGTELGEQIHIEFSLTADEAEEALEQAENSMFKIIAYLSARIH